MKCRLITIWRAALNLSVGIVMVGMSCVTAALAENDISIPNFHALVIGVATYHPYAGEGWLRLHSAAHDAQAVGELLQNQYGFDVTFLLDEKASKTGIMRELDRLVEYGEDDAVLVYYAGHGYYDPAIDEGFWIPVDARYRSKGRDMREDWIWNSMITKIISASKARHILVVADACYSGSLFRGWREDRYDHDPTWYAWALRKPSRFLISSSDYEPALDSGSGHSVFAQTFLNYLSTPDTPIFSASDIGRNLRKNVGKLTGQMVRMGPMAVARNAGGEFVFIEKDGGGDAVDTLNAAFDKNVPTVVKRYSYEEQMEDMNSYSMLRSAALLSDMGATNAARSMINQVDEHDSHLVGMLASTLVNYLNHDAKQAQQNQFRDTIDRLRALKKRAEQEGTLVSVVAQPRVVGLLEPETVMGTPDELGTALLYHIMLLTRLKESGRAVVVERDAMQEVLEELELGGSTLSDQDARLQLGKILPASVLINVQWVSLSDANEVIIRVIDTQTGEVLQALHGRINDADSMLESVDNMAKEITDQLVKDKPLQAEVAMYDEDVLTAGVGSFHEAKAGDVYLVFKGEVPHSAMQPVSDKNRLGRAELSELGEKDSRFKVSWISKPESGVSLWVREETD